MTETGTAVEFRGVRRSYGATHALDGLDLTLRPGELLALLGPSGCGKTTALRLLAGFDTPTAGEILIGGRDVVGVPVAKRDTGMVFQAYSLFPTMTAAENVAFGLRMRRVGAAERARRAGELLEVVGLGERGGSYPHQLSGGQQQRVALAMALVGDPDLLLLDEPTVGLDVTARRAFWAQIARRRDAGAGLVLTTHIVEEAAAVADRVVVLHRGRVIAAGTPGALTARLPDRTITARTTLDDVALRALPGVGAIVRDGDRVRVGTAEPERVLRGWLAADDALAELRVEGAGLEQALVALTGAEVPA